MKKIYTLLFLIILLCPLQSCKKINFKNNQENNNLLPVILDTNKFEDFKPGWVDKGYTITNNYCLHKKRTISITVKE